MRLPNFQGTNSKVIVVMNGRFAIVVKDQNREVTSTGRKHITLARSLARDAFKKPGKR